MRRFVAILLLALPWIATAAVHADPLYDIKVSGDGHVFDFVTPNPVPAYDHPHAVYASFSGGPGTVDGVGGYSFSGSLDIASRGFSGPNFSFSGALAGFTTGFSYSLYGPQITSVVYVPVSYNPIYNSLPGSEFYQDQLISSFVPGDYAFRGFVGENLESFDVLVTEESGPVVTPEPATWMLLTTGGAGLSALLRRRRTRVCEGRGK